MIFDKNETTLNAWKAEMHQYQKGKRTKKPFGQTLDKISHVTHQQMKAKECSFDPILQTYKQQQDELRATFTFENNRAKSLINHLRNTVKHEKNFDIINLKSNEPFAQKASNRKQGPIRNAYNVINNQKIPDYYFQNRQVKLVVEKQKKLLGPTQKQFNILTNVYRQDHQERLQHQIQKQNNQISNKYWKTHDFNPVFGTYYDENKEQQFQQVRKNQDEEHGKDADKVLPPSYVHRQPLILDYTKAVPETLKQLDQKNANAKKRYQIKYLVTDEYQKRNIEEDEKQESVLKNHVHFGRVLDEKVKEFDIVTNKPYKQTRAEQLYGKKIEVSSWDQLIKEAARGTSNIKSGIKSGGFL